MTTKFKLVDHLVVISYIFCIIIGIIEFNIPMAIGFGFALLWFIKYMIKPQKIVLLHNAESYLIIKELQKKLEETNGKNKR